MPDERSVASAGEARRRGRAAAVRAPRDRSGRGGRGRPLRDPGRHRGRGKRPAHGECVRRHPGWPDRRGRRERAGAGGRDGDRRTRQIPVPRPHGFVDADRPGGDRLGRDYEPDERDRRLQPAQPRARRHQRGKRDDRRDAVERRHARDHAAERRRDQRPGGAGEPVGLDLGGHGSEGNRRIRVELPARRVVPVRRGRGAGAAERRAAAHAGAGERPPGAAAHGEAVRRRAHRGLRRLRPAVRSDAAAGAG